MGIEVIAGRWASIRARCALARALFVALALIATVNAAAAAEAEIKATTENGFGRLLLSFKTLPKYKVEVKAGVVVIEFGEPVVMNIASVPVGAPDYVVVGRIDPNGKTARFALAQPVRINTIEVGGKLFIDLLPESWKGAPPGPPKSVLAALQKQIEEATKAARREAARKAALAKSITLDLRIVEKPTFSRVEFDWSGFVNAALRRRGNQVVIEFDRAAKADFGRLKADPPPFINGAKHKVKDERLTVVLEVDTESDVKGFREGLSYIVDIHGAPDRVAGKKDNSIRPFKPEERPKGRKEVVKLEGARPDADSAGANAEAEKDAKPGPVLPKIAVDADSDPHIVVRELRLDRNGEIVGAQRKPASKKAQPEPVLDGGAEASDDAPAKQRPKRKQAGKPADKAAPAPKQAASAKSPPAAEPEPDEADQTGPIKAEIEATDSAVRIDFAFAKPTPAAVFRRANTLWIVFESERDVDISAIKAAVTALFSGATHVRSGDAQIVRIDLSGAVPAAMAPDKDDWVVTLGELVVEPTAPVSLKRGVQKNGSASITIGFEGHGGLHWLKDPVVGDELVVVTGLAPARGFIKPQAFVEFMTLATAHGIALVPLADDLDVKVGSGKVLVTRKDGLNLSAGGAGQYLAGRKAIDDTARPGFMDFKTWKRGDKTAFGRNLSKLQSAVAAQKPKESIKARIDLTRFMLAHGLANEAVGQLALVSEIDPEISSDPVFNALRGVAFALTGRNHMARKDLSVHGLSQDPHTRIWRSLVEIKARRWQAAHRDFRELDRLIGLYSPELQATFRLGAIRAAIEVNDLSTAEIHLEKLGDATLSDQQSAEALVLRGRFMEGLGRFEEAGEAYVQAIATHQQRAEAEATLRATLMGLKRGDVAPAEAINKLETVAFMWRGDEIELAAMRKLAELYGKKADYRRALEVMRTAVKTYPNKETARLIEHDMRNQFKALFFDGRADKLAPFEALSMFHDFRALTPPGRQGDEMIRKLADRLIKVDLLTQASDLLAYQVDKRLKGAARAQVASRLALVHLINKKPAKALDALRRTRQALLPNAVKTQRTMLEARALAELGRAKLAVALLDNLETPAAARLKAEAYWLGDEWREAGEAYELLLGERWKTAQPLSDKDRVDVMRAAISYQLADDKIGLQRFGQKFTQKMANTPDAQAFRVVTGTVDKSSVDFRNLAREIAGIDTLESFIKEFKAAAPPAKKKVSQAEAGKDG